MSSAHIAQQNECGEGLSPKLQEHGTLHEHASLRSPEMFHCASPARPGAPPAATARSPAIPTRSHRRIPTLPRDRVSVKALRSNPPPAATAPESAAPPLLPAKRTSS